MTRNFCAGVCATLHKWEIVQIGNVDDATLMMRKSVGNPGEPPGVILSATTTVWMPVAAQRLFDFLRNEQTRSQWDVLSQDGPVQQMIHIAKGQDLGNSISLLRAVSTISTDFPQFFLIYLLNLVSSREYKKLMMCFSGCKFKLKSE